MITIKDILVKQTTLIESGEQLCVQGWVKTFRSAGSKNKSNRLGFMKISDGSCIDHLQVVFSESDLANFDDLVKAKTGACVKVFGKLISSPAKGQTCELAATSFEVVGEISNPDTYPIAKAELSLEHLRKFPHLRGRTDTLGAVMRIKSALSMDVRKYFESVGFYEVHCPTITDNMCEGGCQTFTCTSLSFEPNSITDFSKDFFNKRVYLTVSAQLHLECLIMGSLSKAFTMTRAFRAEASDSKIHTAEIEMLELEATFSTLQENIKVNEECLKYIINGVLTKCRKDLEFLQSKFKPDLIETLERYVINPFAVTTHEECVRLMLEDIASGKVKVDPEKKPEDGLYVFREAPGFSDDLSKDHEKYICSVLNDRIPTFVCNYPAKIKSFYMPKINKGAEIERVDNFDMLMPDIGEVVGGSQRESNYDELIERMVESGINPDTMTFYSDLRKYGTCKHGGSGIGVDRLMLVLTGLNNIRDTTPFFRGYGECMY